MLRFLIALALLTVGFGFGVAYERWQMRMECANGAGDWTGTICVGSELLQ